MRNIFCFSMFFFLALITYSQNYSERYNKLYDRYDFVDSSGTLVGYRVWNDLYKRWDMKDSSGNLYAYKKYNSLYERWDYVDLSTTSNTNSRSQGNGIINYGKSESTFDTNLAMQALAYKQAQYDRLTPEQKSQLAERRGYQQKREWVISNGIKWMNKTKRVEKKQDKFKIREDRKLKRLIKKPKINITTLSDGWYEVIITDTYWSSKSSNWEDVYATRAAYIKNGKVSKYVNNNNIKFSFDNAFNNGSFNYKGTLSIPSLDISGEIEFFIINNSPIKQPAYFQGTKVYFYTQQNIPGNIYIEIFDKKNKVLYNLSSLKEYFPNEQPNCKTKDGVSSIILPPGKYRYFARTETIVWNNEFTIVDTDRCQSFKLRGN